MNVPRFAAARSRPARRDSAPPRRPVGRRRGAFAVIAAVGLFALVGFVALGVDLGMISLTRARMQQTADAAALAAAQEIPASLESLSDPSSVDDMDGYTSGAARAMAERVADLNGVYVDPRRDVRFGRRSPLPDGGYAVTWGAGPYNAVEVTVRRDNPDHSAPDAELPAFFSRVFGLGGQALVTHATAYVEPRDLVLVLDYSASMGYDSSYLGFDHLEPDDVRANLDEIYDALQIPSLPDFPDEPQFAVISENVGSGTHLDVTFGTDGVSVASNVGLGYVAVRESAGWKVYDSNDAKQFDADTRNGNVPNAVSVRRRYGNGNLSGWLPFVHDDTDSVMRAFGLDHVAYPFEGGGWDDYISKVKTSYYGGYAVGDWRKYGRRSFVNYLTLFRTRNAETGTLWKAPVYPFEAMKNGTSLLLDYVRELEWGDHVGLVSYDTAARWETSETDPDEGIAVDISADPITTDYAALDAIQRHRNGGYYQATTGVGDGIAEAKRMLAEHGRYGARPTILLMTDGNANVSPPGWSLPDDWDWDEVTDFDGDGPADYTTDDVHKQYAFYRAKQAIDSEYTIHTLTVGAAADRDLLTALARAAGGHYVDVPGGSSIADMETQLTAAFAEFAARVPPPRLLVDRPDAAN